MLTSLAFIFLVGLALGAVCQKLKLPRIIGMLVTGIILGPFVLNLLDASILSISADLRKIALIIILLKAGLSLDLSDLKKAGRAAVLLSFVPASFEILGYTVFAPAFFGIDRYRGCIYDPCSIAFPHDWCFNMYYKDTVKLERTALLRDCISSKGDSSGGYRIGSACNGSFLWKSDLICSGPGDHHHSTLGCDRH